MEYEGTYELSGFGTYKDSQLKTGYEREEIHSLTPIWTLIDPAELVINPFGHNTVCIFFNPCTKRWELHRRLRTFTICNLTCETGLFNISFTLFLLMHKLCRITIELRFVCTSTSAWL